MKEKCCHGHEHKAVKMLIAGLLVIANDQLKFMSWWSFVGALLLLKGLFVLVISKKQK